MSLQLEESLRNDSVYDIARKMLTAARTAPKARGKDNLVMAIIGKEEIDKISEKIKQLNEREPLPAFFLRDAENILSAEYIVLIGTKIRSMGVDTCGLCGFKDCEEKNQHPNHPCAFNTSDLGIAVGSAVSIATDNRVDNRIMFTVGYAAVRLNMLGEEVNIAFGIPLSATGKNPFFDRK